MYGFSPRDHEPTRPKAKNRYDKSWFLVFPPPKYENVRNRVSHPEAKETSAVEKESVKVTVEKPIKEKENTPNLIPTLNTPEFPLSPIDHSPQHHSEIEKRPEPQEDKASKQTLPKKSRQRASSTKQKLALNPSTSPTSKRVRFAQDASPTSKKVRFAQDASPTSKKDRFAQDASPTSKKVRFAQDASPTSKEDTFAQDASPTSKKITFAQDVSSVLEKVRFAPDQSPSLKKARFAMDPVAGPRSSSSSSSGSNDSYVDESLSVVGRVFRSANRRVPETTRYISPSHVRTSPVNAPSPRITRQTVPQHDRARSPSYSDASSRVHAAALQPYPQSNGSTELVRDSRHEGRQGSPRIAQNEPSRRAQSNDTTRQKSRPSYSDASSCVHAAALQPYPQGNGSTGLVRDSRHEGRQVSPQNAQNEPSRRAQSNDTTRQKSRQDTRQQETSHKAQSNGGARLATCLGRRSSTDRAPMEPSRRVQSSNSHIPVSGNASHEAKRDVAPTWRRPLTRSTPHELWDRNSELISTVNQSGDTYKIPASHPVPRTPYEQRPTRPKIPANFSGHVMPATREMAPPRYSGLFDGTEKTRNPSLDINANIQLWSNTVVHHLNAQPLPAQPSLSRSPSPEPVPILNRTGRRALLSNKRPIFVTRKKAGPEVHLPSARNSNNEQSVPSEASEDTYGLLDPGAAARRRSNFTRRRAEAERKSEPMEYKAPSISDEADEDAAMYDSNLDVTWRDV